MDSVTKKENNSADQEVSQPNMSMGEVEPQADQAPAHAHIPEADRFGDLLSPLAIEGPPGVSGALAPVEEQENGVKVRHIKKGINPASLSEIHFSGPFLTKGFKIGVVTGLITLTEAVAIGRTFAGMKDY
ncbi:high affinity sulfate transporter [Artemisia annua]|uniref:High affinity sulfate transporter n=1 Tax=Artemisia annua TaxID=35608 RepID=A0A2U1ND64_ARTAN|nr:high affinity sulfate transporter [Artemisia annua]